MIVYFSQGQLGNQLFQASLLKRISEKDETIYVLGFNELLTVFEVNESIINISKNSFTKYLKAMRFVFSLLAKFNIITYVKPVYVNLSDGYVKESTEIEIKSGLFKSIKFIKTASYESEKHFCVDIKENFTIKDSFLKSAEQYLRGYEDCKKIFVHIRLGDYDNYTALGKDVKLPFKYYIKLINKIKTQVNDSLFVFLSNKPDMVEEMFKNVENKLISRNNYGTDFAIMTLCDYGILSASTFSFWGAYLMEDRKKVYAPKYWKGFNSNIEYPISGFPSFAEPIDVN